MREIAKILTLGSLCKSEKKHALIIQCDHPSRKPQVSNVFKVLAIERCKRTVAALRLFLKYTVQYGTLSTDIFSPFSVSSI